jgi:phage repressor protein C with HTH and peptisase S24 domain
MDKNSITFRDFNQHISLRQVITASDNVTAMSIGSKIKAAREAKGLSQAELAERCGWDSQGRVGNYEKDTREPKIDDLRKIARVLDKPLIFFLENGDFDDLSSSRRAAMLEHESATDLSEQEAADRIPLGVPIIEWNDPSDLPEGAYVFVPRYDVHVSAGNGHTVQAEPLHERPQAFRSEWVKRKRLQHNGLMCVYAKGDSMEPRINDGDSLLVDRNQKTMTDGRVYVLRFGDEVRVKRLFKRPDGGLIIRSDNTDHYPDVIVTAEEMQHVEIIGRVVHVSGEM